MERKIDWEIEEVPVTVEYEVEPYHPGDLHSPPSGGYVYVTDILVKGISIGAIVGDNIISQLEEELSELEKQ